MSKIKRTKIIGAIDLYGEAKVQASAVSLVHVRSLHNKDQDLPPTPQSLEKSI